MIFDRIENISRYSIFPQSFIEEIIDTQGFVQGKFEMKEDRYFGIGLSYVTQESDAALWEAHRKYLDIHIILEGTEFVEIAEVENMESIKDYEDDYELYKGNPEQQICLMKGCFLALFPNEAHKTTIKVKESTAVKKIVYKLLLA